MSYLKLFFSYYTTLLGKSVLYSIYKHVKYALPLLKLNIHWYSKFSIHVDKSAFVKTQSTLNSSDLWQMWRSNMPVSSSDFWYWDGIGALSAWILS